MIDLKYCVKEVIKEATKIEKNFIRKIASKVIGIKINSWGEIVELESTLYKNLKSQPEVIVAKLQLEESIKKQLLKKCYTEKGLSSTVTKLKHRLLQDAENHLYEEVYDILETKIRAELKEQILKDPELIPYFVGSQLMDANKNAPKE